MHILRQYSWWEAAVCISTSSIDLSTTFLPQKLWTLVHCCITYSEYKISILHKRNNTQSKESRYLHQFEKFELTMQCILIYMSQAAMGLRRSSLSVKDDHSSMLKHHRNHKQLLCKQQQHSKYRAHCRKEGRWAWKWCYNRQSSSQSSAVYH